MYTAAEHPRPPSMYNTEPRPNSHSHVASPPSGIYNVDGHEESQSLGRPTSRCAQEWNRTTAHMVRGSRRTPRCAARISAQPTHHAREPAHTHTQTPTHTTGHSECTKNRPSRVLESSSAPQAMRGSPGSPGAGRDARGGRQKQYIPGGSFGACARLRRARCGHVEQPPQQQQDSDVHLRCPCRGTPWPTRPGRRATRAGRPRAGSHPRRSGLGATR